MIVVLFIAGILFLKTDYYRFNIYKDSQGWGWTNLNEDEYRSFFPASYDLDSKIYPDGSGIVQHRENVYIGITNESGGNVAIFIQDERRWLYLPEGKDPVFKIWVEKTSPEYYALYSDTEKNYFESMSGDSNFERINSLYKGIEYQIVRFGGKYLGEEYLKRASSIGNSYIFFKDKNTVVFLFFFNTKYQGCYIESGDSCKYNANERILELSEMEQIVNQLIDSVTGSG